MLEVVEMYLVCIKLLKIFDIFDNFLILCDFLLILFVVGVENSRSH